MLYLGLGGIVFVPIFKTITHLPPYMGMMLALGVVWLVSEYIHPEEDFSKAIDVINKSGYEVDLKQSNRFYDYEPGERDFFPRIKFGFKIQ